jgi:hypothetical protein
VGEQSVKLLVQKDRKHVEKQGTFDKSAGMEFSAIFG